MRIRFYKYPCKEATIIAKQTFTEGGDYTFGPFKLDKEVGRQKCLNIKRPDVSHSMEKCENGIHEPDYFFEED